MIKKKQTLTFDHVTTGVCAFFLIPLTYLKDSFWQYDSAPYYFQG